MYEHFKLIESCLSLWTIALLSLKELPEGVIET